jgi:hypothetical protein
LNEPYLGETRVLVAARFLTLNDGIAHAPACCVRDIFACFLTANRSSSQKMDSESRYRGDLALNGMAHTDLSPRLS